MQQDRYVELAGLNQNHLYVRVRGGPPIHIPHYVGFKITETVVVGRPVGEPLQVHLVELL